MSASFGKPVSALALVALGLVPATSSASNGGAGIAPAPAKSPTAAPGTASAQGTNGVALSARGQTLVDDDVTFRGSVPSSATGAIVVVERRSSDGSWGRIAAAKAARSGAFAVRWRADRGGHQTFRARVANRPSARAASAGTAPRIQLTVYGRARATWYGPGLYGNRTACGITLTPNTLGVAHRTLPCGTRVALLYHGRVLTVPVIDRGPYANGASLDLTNATAKRLGFSATDTVGALFSR